MCKYKAVTRMYFRGCWGQHSEARRAEVRGPNGRDGVGFLGRGSELPPHQLGVLGSAVSSPSWVWGEAPAEIDSGAFPSLQKAFRGDRQGGILSPIFFNIYVDELIGLLRSTNGGWHIAYVFIGCIMYADDLILLSPCVAGLQSMLFSVPCPRSYFAYAT